MNQKPAISQRLRRGLLANLANVAARFLVPVLTLPILFAYWPEDRIGSWLAAYAIPAYFVLFGNGFAGAGGSVALASAQAGLMGRAKADYVASWLIASGTTAVMAVLFVCFGIASAGGAMSHALAGLDRTEILPVFAWLGVYLFAISQTNVLEIPFRVGGRYAEFTAFNIGIQLVEMAALIACVRFGGSPAILAIVLALSRMAFALTLYLASRRLTPALYLTNRTGLRASIAEIWKPSLGFVILPLCLSINVQGYLLAVGAFFGPVLLAGFVAMRTLTRLLDTLVNVLFGLQYYEAGYVEGDRAEVQRRLLSTMTLTCLIVCVAVSALVLLLGPTLQSLLTFGHSAFDRSVAAVLLLGSTVRALGASPMALITAENRHTRIFATYLCGSAICLALASVLGSAGYSLEVVLLGLVLAELSQTIPAIVWELRRLGIGPVRFLASLVSRKRWDDMVLMSRLLVKG